ncbi:MAG: hypothetical protein GXN96_01370 [Aquificae bacterium]|nr:hypothetical protein [Aquificota bacterium]
MKTLQKERIKEILNLPPEAKVKGIIWRWVNARKEKKYPALVYELEGKRKIKHINSRTFNLLMKENLISGGNLKGNLTVCDLEELKIALKDFARLMNWDTRKLFYELLKDGSKEDLLPALRGVLGAVIRAVEEEKFSKEELNSIKTLIQVFWGVLKKATKKR